MRRVRYINMYCCIASDSSSSEVVYNTSKSRRARSACWRYATNGVFFSLCVLWRIVCGAIARPTPNVFFVCLNRTERHYQLSVYVLRSACCATPCDWDVFCFVNARYRCTYYPALAYMCLCMMHSLGRYIYATRYICDTTVPVTSSYGCCVVHNVQVMCRLPSPSDLATGITTVIRTCHPTKKALLALIAIPEDWH